ncbi:MAG TPA: glucokinase [Sphingopyxis sp.]|uniref:glucokinase n=1 Tax=Sphingopyxis sp. TaxID=1908224 RepID=UPI002E0E0E24|nr:glucokinase [Sphingopyxis sp.]
MPRSIAIAVAGPVRGDVIRFTNNPWLIRPALIGEKLHVDRQQLVNDFDAVRHAVAKADEGYFARLSGPDEPLPATGTASDRGPATELGFNRQKPTSISQPSQAKFRMSGRPIS